MYKHILIATDGSDLAAKAVATGIGLAKDLKANVTAVTVTEPWTDMVSAEGAAFSFPIEDYNKAAAERAALILGKVRDDAGKAGVTCETVHATGFPADAIIEAAKSRACDLIVMASHGRRGLARMFLGSQAIQVLTYSTVPVLICR